MSHLACFALSGQHCLRVIWDDAPTIIDVDLSLEPFQVRTYWQVNRSRLKTSNRNFVPTGMVRLKKERVAVHATSPAPDSSMLPAPER